MPRSGSLLTGQSSMASVSSSLDAFVMLLAFGDSSRDEDDGGDEDGSKHSTENEEFETKYSLRMPKSSV